ncbi:MAG: M6 family metalloprotease domain-containing protein [Bacteroidetes bacterium]|uniref:M6 family metalloprotease domain-containing protein n=1 Tax=Candidatus Cryptobacteroides merdavium TaxID=2840769 RepID=A0A9D9HC38_9BACT|nr:M6 family metalloprotease domain-containing protein [Candidatus Cryptobacteroides merdavium]
MKFIRTYHTAAAALVALMMIPVQMAASPARKTEVILTQPDGHSFQAILKGDEFMKLLTTADGCAVIQEEDGWYCYAYYSAEGQKLSSGYRVGEAAPGTVIAESRNIPYQTLLSNAVTVRNSAKPEETGLMKRLNLAHASSGTRSSDGKISKHGLVLLVQFRDLKFSHDRSDFVSLLAEGKNGSGGAIKYFNDQFNDMYDFTFDVSEPVSLSKSYRYYGANSTKGAGNDARPAEMVTDACRLADSQVDFSKYDDDGDGKVDNVFIFYAGADEAEGAGEYHIWSHAWYLESGAGISLTLDGVKIDRYACTSELSGGELAGIGTFCHEYSHTFGLPDLYDTDYSGSGGKADALWSQTSLMDGGNMNNNGNTPPNFNAIEREILGLSQATTIAEEGSYELSPINEEGQYCRIDGENPGEYYLLECRYAEGWDSYIGGSGLLIYHVDKSANDAGSGLTAFERWQTKSNSVNCNPDHQCADLIEASKPASSPASGLQTSLEQLFFPYGEINSFTPYTDPAFTFWNGTNSIFKITDITRDGNRIRFSISKTEATKIPTPKITETDIFQDAAIISWSVDVGFNGKTYIIWGSGNGGEQTAEVKPYSAGNYAVRLEGLTPKTSYSVRIYCAKDGTNGNSTAGDFTTKAVTENGRPYIYLRYTERNDDNTFPIGVKLPLILFNAAEAAETVWTMDGKPVKTGDNGYYMPSSSGLLKATVTYSDGSTDVITKEIRISNGEQ